MKMLNFLFGGFFGDINPTFYLRYDPGGTGLAKFIANVVNAIYILAGLTFFVYLAMGGFKYISAGGDVKQVQEASKQITTAVTGLVIVVASYGIVSVLGNILGVPIFSPVFTGP